VQAQRGMTTSERQHHEAQEFLPAIGAQQLFAQQVPAELPLNRGRAFSIMPKRVSLADGVFIKNGGHAPNKPVIELRGSNLLP